MKTKHLIFITEIIVISLLFSACLKEDELVRPFTTFKPVAMMMAGPYPILRLKTLIPWHWLRFTTTFMHTKKPGW